MALFRKFFYRKPPDGLLEIAERVYVFDYCFTTDVMEEANYKAYIGGIVGALCAHLPDSSFMVFNYREGENPSQICDILQDYDMTVIDYPRQYENVPLLTMEMIHHCLKSGESWLTLGDNNVLLLHCERGGWPVLAFMFAALLIYRKLYSGEQKTLDMIYKQAPRELLQLMSPLNPVPSQLRYLQYVSRRNLGSDWPPPDSVLTLDCIMIRQIPNIDGEGGCRPIFRIFGRDPCTDGRASKVLYSTPKKSRVVRHYKQGESELVKIDIHCHIQGDVVLECISLDEDLERENMMFRVMFSTSFIRSNILNLNRDEIDVLWNSKDRFPKDFRAEIFFSETESTICEEKGGLPIEDFDNLSEVFNNGDWDSQEGVSPNVVQKIIQSNVLKENMEISSPLKSELDILEGFSPGKVDQSPKSPILDVNLKNSSYEEKQSKLSFEAILDKKLLQLKSDNKDTDMTPNKAQTEDLLPGVQVKRLSPRIVQSSHSSSSSSSNSPQGSPIAIQRFNASPFSVGKTALLHDDDTYKGDTNADVVTVSPTSKLTLVSSVPVTVHALKLTQPNSVSSPNPSPSEHSVSKNAELPSIDKTPPSPSIELPSSRPSMVPSVELPSSRPSMVESKTDSSIVTEIPASGKSCVNHSVPLSSQPASVKSSLSTAQPPPRPLPPPITAHAPPSTYSPSSTPRMDGGVKPPPPSLPTVSASAPPPPPPPPPPPTLSASAPPPPPPPNAGSTNSPIAPPPPPPSFGNNGSSQQPQIAGSNRPVPPPPGPRRLPPPLTTRSQSLTKKTNLKPYHWLKITRVMQGSVWAEAQRSDEASKALEFDFSELENLFAASVPNSDKGVKSNRASGPKPDKVQLINLKRAYNCEIMLTKVKIPLPDLMNSVLVLDDSALDVDTVENLIKFCPTKEEMELLENYKGDKENLGKSEKFFLELMKVSRVELKLRVFLFKIQFYTEVSDLRKNLKIVNCASEEIRTSAKLKRIMQTILSLGNALNKGTARGSAVGFRLDSLLKLIDTWGQNNKMTLMHYLCKVLADKMPELLDFSKDLPSLEASTKVQLKFLAEEMQAIIKGLEKVVEELANSENDGPISDNFCKILKEFISSAEGEVRSLELLYPIAGRNADALAMYFGEDPAKCPFEQVVSTLLNFVRMFIRAHDENCKQIEFEKKKAEKEAENARLKMIKDSGQTVPSPRKFGTVK